MGADVALAPVTFFPIAEVKPVKRKEPGPAKEKTRPSPKLARKPDPGTGENVDVWV
jgi:hypothetical protein